MKNINENHGTSKSQTARILEWMLFGNSITPLEALQRFGTMRLGARIADIKALGYDVKGELISVGGKKVKRYYL